jgi:hypothetical protein
MASIKKGRILISYCAINDATGKYETTYELLKQPNSTTVPLIAANRAKSIEMSTQYINGKPKFKNYRVNAGKIKYTKMNDSYNYFYDVPLININDQNDSKCNLPTTPMPVVPEQINPSPSPTGGRKRRKTMRKKGGSRKYKKTRRR